MTDEKLLINTGDGAADAFATYPGGGPHPGVLMYPDAFGPRAEMENKARELAAHGYFVLVPNVFYRHGPAPVIELPAHIGEDVRPGLIGQLMPMIESHTAERILRDAQAYLGYLAERSDEVLAGSPVGVVGYCFGAVMALRTAAAWPDRVAAFGGFHPGMLVTKADDSPHRLLSPLTAKVYLGLSEGDMSPASRSELETALDASGVEYDIEVYSGTIHGYTMSDTDAFDETAARRHWERLVGLLGSTLGAR